MAVWGIGAWKTRWSNKEKLKNGRADSRFCIFVFLQTQNGKGGLIHLIKSTNESFIDYYIYYRHAHLFSQKHKNTKKQNMSTKASLHNLCRLTKHLNFFYTSPGAWHGKNYGMAQQKNFPRHAKKYGIHHQIHLFQKKFTNKKK